MQAQSKRVVAAVLAASAAFVGGWAQFGPRSFYSSFPLPGRHWVSMLGDYNEHLIRDVGGLFGTLDKVGNVVTLGGTVLLAALLLIPTRPGREN